MSIRDEWRNLRFYMRFHDTGLWLVPLLMFGTMAASVVYVVVWLVKR